MRVYVYVDGLNVYYRALKYSRNKWLDLNKLAVRLLNPTDAVEQIKYFTTRVGARPNDPDAPRRQQLYLNALDTLPNIEMHFGRFLSKTKWRPLADNPEEFVNVRDTEEKGSDVNLASHLIHDGWRDVYDLALIMSQDSDLIEPLRLVKEDLGKTVGLIWLDGRQPSPRFSPVISFVRHAARADFAASQFPNPVLDGDGNEVPKPNTW